MCFLPLPMLPDDASHILLVMVILMRTNVYTGSSRALQCREATACSQETRVLLSIIIKESPAGRCGAVSASSQLVAR